jgi:phage gpG-like protein
VLAGGTIEMAIVTAQQLATIFDRASVDVLRARHDILENVALSYENSAKLAIGTYTYGWVPLKPETIARKASGDTPEYETGTLMNSIKHNIDPMANLTGDAYVGSDLEYFKYQEYGTSRIPARPILGGAIMQEEKNIPGMVHEALARLFP